MSAALQLPIACGAASSNPAWKGKGGGWEARPGPGSAPRPNAKRAVAVRVTALDTGIAFYRKHTEKMLRRYLYASMQVGRAPNILGEPVARGWVSSRPVRTFEDAVIFVLDVESCLNQLGSLDRQLLFRVAIQEYTQSEAAGLLGMSHRTISYKFPQALDRLTEKLLQAKLLILPD